tara:strand:+ start:25 stop:444 length:420 start_codon:yes stop_codon:yes gene_type:complete
MSGIIGGAGSRSGNVGETEIDYETGTWTPQSSEGSLFTDNVGRYVKVGRLVFVSGNFDVDDTNTNGTSFTISDLPFIVESGDESLGAGVIHATTPTHEYQLRAQSSSYRIQLYKGASRTYANEKGVDFWFSFSYITQTY